MADNVQKSRADKDKNCLGIIRTIVSGPPERSRSNSDSISGSSSKNNGKQICQVEAKHLKVDNTITFTDEDFEGIETLHQDALVILARIAG